MTVRLKRKEESLEDAVEVFTKKIKAMYGTDNFADVASRICQNPDNIVGEGSTKLVFRINGAEDFVMALLKKEFDPLATGSRFKVCPIELPKYNFGQVLLSNGHGLSVMKKACGVEHSMHKWLGESLGVLKGYEPIAKQKAEEVLVKMCDIACLPLSAYEDFARQVQYLSENGLRVDPVNPNNIMFDKKEKRINMIDILDKQERFADMKGPLNSVRDMECLLLDSLMHTEYMKVLSPKNQEIMKYISGCIIDKCQDAAQNVGLIANPDNTHQHFEMIKRAASKNVDSDALDAFLKHYEAFTELYHDKLVKDKTLFLSAGRGKSKTDLTRD